MTVSGGLGRSFDAVVVGAGPNGLSAATVLAQAGKKVLVLEAKRTIGGGSRSHEMTLPGFLHDPCSAIHALASISPFFRTLPLAEHGLRWVQPPIAMAHPFDDGTAATLCQSVDETATSLAEDGPSYKRLVEPFVPHVHSMARDLLGPIHIFRHPIIMARYGIVALQSGERVATTRFQGDRGRAFFAGMSAHSMLALDSMATAAFGLTLALFGHAVGWPIPVGGSQTVVNALADHFLSLGGTIETDVPVKSLEQIGDGPVVLFDVTPRQFLDIVGDAVPARYRRQLDRYRYGAGVFKIDWALDGPVPWTAEPCRRAGTIHLGGSMTEIAASERDVQNGRHSLHPYVILAQQSLFDETRAPAGKHTLWGYCHVPNGSDVDMTDAVESQIERFAPGFRDLIKAKVTTGPAEMELYNANYIGGDINGGSQDIRQLFTRPAPRLDPYSTPNQRLYFCSSSTPPGGGVHGMAGYHGARSALRRGWQ